MTVLLLQLTERYHWNGMAGYKLLHAVMPEDAGDN